MKRETPKTRLVGRREQKKAETANRIAVASRKLLRSKGFDAITTQEVAIEAGIPPGTLFGYISSKTDLLIIALVHEAIEFVGTIGPRIPAKFGLLDKLQFVFEEMASYHGKDIEVTRHLLRELAVTFNEDLTERSGSLGLAVRAVLSSVIKEYQASGEVTTDISAELISTFLFAQYWHCLRNWIVGRFPRQEYSTLLRDALYWQLKGIAAGKTVDVAVQTTVSVDSGKKTSR